MQLDLLDLQTDELRSLFNRRAELQQLADEALAADDLREWRRIRADLLNVQEQIYRIHPRSRCRILDSAKRQTGSIKRVRVNGQLKLF